MFSVMIGQGFDMMIVCAEVSGQGFGNAQFDGAGFDIDQSNLIKVFQQNPFLKGFFGRPFIITVIEKKPEIGK